MVSEGFRKFLAYSNILLGTVVITLQVSPTKRQNESVFIDIFAFLPITGINVNHFV